MDCTIQNTCQCHTFNTNLSEQQHCLYCCNMEGQTCLDLSDGIIYCYVSPLPIQDLPLITHTGFDHTVGEVTDAGKLDSFFMTEESANKAFSTNNKTPDKICLPCSPTGSPTCNQPKCKMLDIHLIILKSPSKSHQIDSIDPSRTSLYTLSSAKSVEIAPKTEAPGCPDDTSVRIASKTNQRGSTPGRTNAFNKACLLKDISEESVNEEELTSTIFHEMRAGASASSNNMSYEDTGVNKNASYSTDKGMTTPISVSKSTQFDDNFDLGQHPYTSVEEKEFGKIIFNAEPIRYRDFCLDINEKNMLDFSQQESSTPSRQSSSQQLINPLNESENRRSKRRTRHKSIKKNEDQGLISMLSSLSSDSCIDCEGLICPCNSENEMNSISTSRSSVEKISEVDCQLNDWNIDKQIFTLLKLKRKQIQEKLYNRNKEKMEITPLTAFVEQFHLDILKQI